MVLKPWGYRFITYTRSAELRKYHPSLDCNGHKQRLKSMQQSQGYCLFLFNTFIRLLKTWCLLYWECNTALVSDSVVLWTAINTVELLASSRDMEHAAEVWSAHFSLTPHQQILFSKLVSLAPIGHSTDFVQLPPEPQKALDIFVNSSPKDFDV